MDRRKVADSISHCIRAPFSTALLGWKGQGQKFCLLTINRNKMQAFSELTITIGVSYHQNIQLTINRQKLTIDE